MNLLFLMDPLATVKFDKDTSFIFMIGAARRGHAVFYLPHDGISLRDDRMLFDVTPVTPQLDRNRPFVLGEPQRLTDLQVDAVFVRSDPPFNQQYLNHTWLLDRLPARTPVINSPHGLRTVNEKIWATRFTDLAPPTLVTRSFELFSDFVTEHGRVIAKPTDGYGGQGVFFVEHGDTNTRVIYETLTQNGRRELIVQRFIVQAEQGDKRILLLDGEPLGAVLRVHGEKDHRNNFFAGGSAHRAEISSRDLKIIDTLKPHLRELGLHFVGIDVIGDYLIEVNVTSPTCVQEINRLNGVQLEDRVIEYVEQLVANTGQPV